MVGVTTIVMTLLVALSAAAWMGTHWVEIGEAAVVSHQLEVYYGFMVTNFPNFINLSVTK